LLDMHRATQISYIQSFKASKSISIWEDFETYQIFLDSVKLFD